MKYFLIILLVFIGCASFAQRKAKDIRQVINKLDDALIKKDSVALKRMLRNDLRYCHSTGWVQTKKDVIGDLYNGTVTYTKFVPSADTFAVTFIGTDVAMVRFSEYAAGIWKGKAVEFSLNVFMLWVFRDKHWILAERMAIPLTIKNT